MTDQELEGADGGPQEVVKRALRWAVESARDGDAQVAEYWQRAHGVAVGQINLLAEKVERLEAEVKRLRGVEFRLDDDEPTAAPSAAPGVEER